MNGCMLNLEHTTENDSMTKKYNKLI
uniref:Uncharacterized protein n=1 Tax=Anguilla anguilla TaxID=7936 RepID=A0A0E9PD31_ANGAN